MLMYDLSWEVRDESGFLCINLMSIINLSMCFYAHLLWQLYVLYNE